MHRRLLDSAAVLLVLLHWCGPNIGTAAAADGAETLTLYRTAIQGGTFDPEFMDLAPEGAWLIGIDIGLGKFGGNDVICAARPIYLVNNEEVLGRQHGTDTSRLLRAMAKPGYAIAGLTLKAGLVVDGMSVTFMKVTDHGRLDTTDAYQTAWVGGKGGDAPVRVAGTGDRVVGIIGKATKSNVTGLGLIVLSAVKAPATKPAETATQPPNAAVATSGSPKLTRENFDRIQNGMMEDQVREILGPPGGTAQRTVNYNGTTMQTRTLTWRLVDPNLTIMVTLRNEKVSGKNWRQIGAPRP